VAVTDPGIAFLHYSDVKNMSLGLSQADLKITSKIQALNELGFSPGMVLRVELNP
jgi:hypothetical protein